MKSFKILLPIATAVGASAIAVSSGATYPSTRSVTISSVASGPLTQANSRDRAAIFDASNIKPGDVVNASLTIRNTATRFVRLQLTETESVNPFGGGLSMVITNTTAERVVYAGTFGDLAAGGSTDLGVVGPGEANDYAFRVELDPAVTNTGQGRTAAASFQWQSVQADPSTDD
ncbi:hypothetical protein [Aeromicrobium chenweiae]|uniref:Uncharacterized protein n=1 Tax=Aeromicrobium chenweiae TaxID=2079793 RepID=A0A2S0WIV8_9ACTN|nr:hypothetical protein [Aeromicrobium chenweiae]AWB91170.1 hypothetical protein C3E78_02435 [Aeromicrobium chenweiae]TGN31689.1 hypothetical protein E4L97_11945 [Aeromicrobium chenweiae]